MGRKPRPRLIVGRRRAQVAELYIQGWTQVTIAQQVGVSQSTICEDLQAIHAEWRKSAIRSFDLARDLELQKLDRIEREAWAGWERSQKPEQAARFSSEGGENSTTKFVRNQVGDPRFLEQVQKCVAQRRALLGLDMAPQFAEAEVDATLSPEQRREQLLVLVTTLRDRERTANAGAESGDSQSRRLCHLGQPG